MNPMEYGKTCQHDYVVKDTWEDTKSRSMFFSAKCRACLKEKTISLDEKTIRLNKFDITKLVQCKLNGEAKEFDDYGW